MGIIYGRDGQRSESKGDFAIEKTGYLTTVKRAIDCEERYVHTLCIALVAGYN